MVVAMWRKIARKLEISCKLYNVSDVGAVHLPKYRDYSNLKKRESSDWKPEDGYLFFSSGEMWEKDTNYD
jgi:hypothetical protein